MDGQGFGRSRLFTILGAKLGNTVLEYGMSLASVIPIWKRRNILSS